MWNKIALLQKNLVWNIPFFMILGLVFGWFQDPVFLKAFILPLTFLMVYPMMVNLQIKKVFSGGDIKVQLVTQVLNFLLIPFVAFAIGMVFFQDKPLIALGLLLASLLPTSGMTISWTGFAKGNLNAAIKMTVIGLVFGSIATPFYTKWLMGAVVEIPLFKVFKQIFLIVFLPMFLGFITQRLIIFKFGMAKYQKDIKQKFPMLSTLGVLGIVFVAMALKSRSVLNNPTILIYLFIPLALLYLINFVISTLVGKYFFKRGDAIALVYGTVMRNLSIALAIAMTVFGEKGSEIALIIAMAYIIQVQAAAWYVRFTDRIFGKAEEQVAEQVMHEGVFSLTEKATVQDAIKLLDEEHIHSVAVLSKDDKPIGLITSEMIINMLADGAELSAKLGEITLEPALTFDRKSSLCEVIKAMKRAHEYKVLVTDEKGELKGVITQMDLIRTICSKDT
jgi:ACR3 family arsenite efflux pump ArsB